MSEEIYTITIPNPSGQHLKNPKEIMQEIADLHFNEDNQEDGYILTEKKTILQRLGNDGKVEYEMGGNPEWGFGCPSGCGKFYSMIPEEIDEVQVLDSDGITRTRIIAKSTSHFKPQDPMTYTGEIIEEIFPEDIILKEQGVRVNKWGNVVAQDKNGVYYSMTDEGVEYIVEVKRNVTQGYLNFRIDPDDNLSRLMECHRCGAKIRLVKAL